MVENNAGLVSTLERVEREAWVDLYNAAPDHLRSLIGIRVEQIGTAAALVLSTIDYPDFNRLIGLGVDEPATEEILDHFLELYRAAGIRKFLIHLAPNARPAILRDWLIARGLVPSRRWAKAYREPDSVEQIQTNLRIAPVGLAGSGSFGRTVCAGFGMPDSLAPWTAALVGRPGWRQFVALEGDQPVGTGALYLRNHAGWLGIGATRPSHRRRGAQGALMARRIEEGFNAGCELLVTETAEDLPEKPNPSFHNMMRTGFQLAYMRENFGWPT
jgi:GNAT superfamily N-acetyltransferase